ncbi:NAPDH-dependent diflavin reductase [Podospora pseudoanserina]|uniref:NAPDH-dependent diflavin reductase n=1 Tax=Podospora pseudoanserina TaxID=2609844 RepID=A0ABR0HT65_9PEZI|nr:NAPDH-dependent diflavin reductase [Podospora pseudoanserina]
MSIQVESPAKMAQLASPVEIEGRSMAILYGSETGNAEEIAIELEDMARRLHFHTRMDEMDSFKLSDLLKVSLVVFVTSTTGQGDMPTNTLNFWKNLRREKLNNSNCLGPVKFAIFGLGDSGYRKFNWAARKLQVRLLQLGATEFFRAAEADERHNNGIDSIYLPWKEEFKAALLEKYPLPEGTAPIPNDQLLPPKYSVRVMPTMEPLPADKSATQSALYSHVDNPMPLSQRRFEHNQRQDATFPAWEAREDQGWEIRTGTPVDVLDKNNILKDHPSKYSLETTKKVGPRTPLPTRLAIPQGVFAKVVDNARVTPFDHWQDVRHIVFDVYGGEKLISKVSDMRGQSILSIYPKNYPEDVQELINLMGWNDVADKPLDMSNKPKRVFDRVDGQPSTLRDILTDNLDITAIPKRNFIRELTFFTKNRDEVERLWEFLLPGNEQEFYDYTSRPRRTILELLSDFPGVKIPVERVLDLFPVIRHRDFSVCNGGASLTENQYDPDAPNGTLPVFPLRIEILAALVEYKTIIRKPRQGLCSRYLKYLARDTPLTVRISPSRGENVMMPLPTAVQRPLIAVATGTGIAPIRALIQERLEYEVDTQVGETVLFYGGRNRDRDYHFGGEWEYIKGLTVFPCFSRDEKPAALEEKEEEEKKEGGNVWEKPIKTEEEENVEFGIVEEMDPDRGKRYVQNEIRKRAKEVAGLMRRGPVVAVCGSAGKMPIAVRKAFVDVLVGEKLVRDREEGERWLGMRVVYWEDTW